MTGVSVLLAEVQAVGVQLGVDGGKLRIKVPRGVLTATQRAQLVEHRAEIIRLLAEPVDYGPDAVVADLKTVFTGDGLARHAAAERLARARGVDGPAGDDLPAWQSWMNRRYTVWRTRGFSQAEARRIVWGEAENAWHLRHQPVVDPDRCAGCGKRLPAGTGQRQIDGAVVHIGDPEQVECLAIHGAQWRSAASVGRMALGLMRTQS
jgi:TubC N-terminal docking domain